MGQGKSNAVWSQNAGMELVKGREMCYSVLWLAITNYKQMQCLIVKSSEGVNAMMDHLNQMDTQESTVKVDLLHLDPTDPDGGCCCGHHSGGHCCGRHRHGQENQPNAEE